METTNQQRMWEAYQNDEALAATGAFRSGRHRFLADRALGKGRILNIGVGNGAFEEFAQRRGADIWCVDPSAVSIERLRERLGFGERAKIGYSQSLPFADNFFNCVVMSEVLEHLNDAAIEQSLREIRRILLRDGRFIGTVSADEVLDTSTVICPCCGERFHRWGHVQSFSRERLAAVLRGVFGQVSVRRVVLPDVGRLNWKGKISWAMKVVQATIDRKGSNQSFYFEAIKD